MVKTSIYVWITIIVLAIIFILLSTKYLNTGSSSFLYMAIGTKPFVNPITDKKQYSDMLNKYKPTRSKINTLLSRYNQIKDSDTFKKAVSANKELNAYVRLGYIDSPYNYGAIKPSDQNAFFSRNSPQMSFTS